ncbi:MAG: YihA family ribosome biogenesis GTP-binding protein, partial [Parabacteroides sp.]|nr:YihA family ribosome biogenesis GTP-binding protein [Parabacteroides sp.]
TKKLLESWEELPPILLTSSEKKEGKEELLNYIDEITKSL